VAFPCPGCDARIDRRPSRWALRCPACRALLRSRPLDDGRESPAYEVEVVGRPETRRRVEVPWDEREKRRLSAWLLWSSAITLALVAVLFVLARLAR
jgi:hypothetical protein